MNKQKYMVVIAGSTGVGKTDFALQFGTVLPIEIVNADLGQFYKPLTIGTAKPHWQQEPILHHLFDIYDEPTVCTVVEYRARLLTCLQEIWDRGSIPVIVGGSTFYIESIFFEPQSSISSATIANVPLDATASLWDQLYRIDPQRAHEIHPHDIYRIKRALDLWNATGIKPSEKKPVYNPPAPYYFLYLTRERNDLYARINERVGHMIAAGWLDEIQTLLGTPWEVFVKEKKFIGYPELMQYITTHTDNLGIVLADIAKKTRNYAKRQETYWRRLEKKLSNCLVESPEYTNTMQSKVFVINLTAVSLDVYIKQLSEKFFTQGK